MKTPEQLQAYAASIVSFNQCLHDSTYPVDRELLGLTLTDLLFDLLEYWSSKNNTMHIWMNATPEDMGNNIFLHAYNEMDDTMLNVGIDAEGIYLGSSIAYPFEKPGMPDYIWSQWLRLGELGKLEFDSSDDPANLHIVWAYDAYSIADVIKYGTLAFQRIHQLNHRLKNEA